jgi:hypothetical protein
MVYTLPRHPCLFVYIFHLSVGIQVEHRGNQLLKVLLYESACKDREAR